MNISAKTSYFEISLYPAPFPTGIVLDGNIPILILDHDSIFYRKTLFDGLHRKIRKYFKNLNTNGNFMCSVSEIGPQNISVSNVNEIITSFDRFVEYRHNHLMYLLKRLDDTSNIKAIYENDNIKNMRRSYYNFELDFLKQYRHGGLRSWKHV